MKLQVKIHPSLGIWGCEDSERRKDLTNTTEHREAACFSNGL